jgi:LacI family repressor for deo operon, udp, cdd, tsx, nupC, and nupG
VPADLAVVGFDDIPFATYFYPPLTTVAQPKVEMGQRAMKMALSLMTANQEGEPLANIVVQGRLVVRASTVRD